MALTEAEKRADKKEKPSTKVIVRRLPPTMTKEQFLNQVSPLPDYNYMYHVKGDMSLGENAFSRAYINFVCPEDVYAFKEKFDNYVFVDTRGHEYTAVVEFAPFQKVPKKKGGKVRMDPKSNTIETDTYYLEFVENLNKPAEQNAKPEYSLQLGGTGDDKNKDVSTPLLEFIKNKRAQKMKIREVRREERERRKKEYERRKDQGRFEGKYYEDKKYDEKSPSKAYGKKLLPKSFIKNDSARDESIKGENSEKLAKSPREKVDENLPEKLLSPESKVKEKKYEEKKERREIKPRFPKKDYNTEFKGSDGYTSKPKQYDEHKKEDIKVKRVKKYSERREERKLEVQKAEQRKLEQAKEKDILSHDCGGDKTGGEVPPKEHAANVEEKKEPELKKKDVSDEKSDGSRKMRNKDRPTIPIYRPGMLSRKKTSDRDESPKNDKSEGKKE